MTLPPTQPNEVSRPANTEPDEGESAKAPASLDPAAEVNHPDGEPDSKTRDTAPDANDENDYLTEEELHALCSPGPSLETFLRCVIIFLLGIAGASVLFPAG